MALGEDAQRESAHLDNINDVKGMAEQGEIGTIRAAPVVGAAFVISVY